MVKTRQAVESDDETEDAFVSIDRHSRRRIPKIEKNDNGSDTDESGPVEEEPRRSTRNATSHRIFHPSSEEDDVPVKRETRSTRRSCMVEEENDDNGNGVEDDEVILSPQRISKRKRHRSSVDRHDSYIRRSSRQPKLQYESFNTTLIEHQQMVTGRIRNESMRDSPRKFKRRRTEIDMEQDIEDKDLDMYARVKRVRKQVKRDMYGVPINDQDNTTEDDETSENAESSSSGEEEEEEKESQSRKYNLRVSRPRTQHFEIPIEPHRPRLRAPMFARPSTPPRRRSMASHHSPGIRSPYKRKTTRKKKKVPTATLR